MKNKKRNLITIDLSGCKNWNECMKIINMITSGKVKLSSRQYLTDVID
jgi:hypothetical protein